MKEALIDTDIISMFLRGHEIVESKVSEYISAHDNLNISILTYYEIISGLRYKNSQNMMKTFLDFSKTISIIPLSKESCNKSAEIYAELRKKGEIIDDIDILIAGICVEHNFILVTNNTKHFSRIKQIEVSNWAL